MDRTAITLIVLGLALALVAGFADQIGVGDDKGFHYRQAIGVAVGAAIALAGVVVAIKRSRESRAEPPASRPQEPPA